MGNHFILPFLDVWNSHHPEENELTRAEQRWTLLSLEAHLSKQLHDIHTRRPDRAEKKPGRPRLRSIQCGMPAKKAKRNIE